jgi:tetratricopeptide (TPR) repeat protein
LGGLGLFWLLGHARADRTQWDTVRTALDVVAFVVVAGALLGWARQALAAPSWSAFFQGRNPVPFGHSVYTAGAALLAGSWLAAGAFVASGLARTWRALGVVAAGLVIVSSASRAGVAAAAVAGALVAFGWWGRRGWRGRDAAIGALTLAVAVVAGVSTNARLREFVVRGEWSAIAAASNDHRLAMADAGRALGSAHGFFGPGPGTVPLAYHAGDARVPHAPDGSLQVHSAPLQIWATTGPAGLLALVALLGAIAPVVLRNLRPSAPAEAHTLAAGVVGYGVFALTDHQFDLPFIATFAAAHVAALAASVPGAARGRHPLALRAALAAAGLLALAGPAWHRARDLAARAAFATAAEAHDAGNLPAVQSALATAAQRAPWDRFYLEAAAAWSWDRDPDFARRQLESVLAAPSPWPSEFATYNLAWLALARGDPAAAAGHFPAAARLAPQRTGVFLGHALALAANGDAEGADEAFARQLLADPRSVVLSLWEQPGLRARLPRILVRIRELATALAAQTDDPGLRARLDATATKLAWWMETDATRLRTLLAALPPADRPPFAALLDAPAAGDGPWTGGDTWGLLAATWAEGRPTADAPEAWRAPLAARLAAFADFRTFVTAPATQDAFRRAYRVGRGGYRVVMRHPASPDLHDFAAFEENLLLAPWLDTVFPARGWIPGALWRALEASPSPAVGL